MEGRSQNTADLAAHADRKLQADTLFLEHQGVVLLFIVLQLPTYSCVAMFC